MKETTNKKKQSILSDIVTSKRLIASLSKNDFKTKFAGSYLGTIWAFIQPVVTVLVYWFVFQVGLRSPGVKEFPFILWLMAGLVPWFYFSEALSGGTNALVEYNYLVKKVVFKISVLPVVKVLSALFTHLFFVLFVFVLCWCYGYKPDLYSLQLIYYIGCSILLVSGLAYLTSATVCFFKDLTQIINIVLQIGVWMTPIMWDINNILHNPILIKIFKLNPVYYIVDGFRDALLYKAWFYEKGWWTLYFWAFTLFMFWLGTSVFKKLRVHFADVL